MPANRRAVWIFVVTVAASVSLGGYRVVSLSLRNEFSLGALIGEALGALILAILAGWAVQLVMQGKEVKNWIAAMVVSAVALAVAGLLYLPQGTTFLQAAILAGVCQLLMAAYAVTALRPKVATALVRRNRLRK